MWPIKLNIKNCLRKLKLVQQLGFLYTLVHFLVTPVLWFLLIQILFLRSSSVVLQGLLWLQGTKSWLTVICLYTIQQDPNLLIILVFTWGPEKKKILDSNCDPNFPNLNCQNIPASDIWSNTPGVYGEYSGTKTWVFLSNGCVRVTPTQQNVLLCGGEKKRKLCSVPHGPCILFL